MGGKKYTRNYNASLDKWGFKVKKDKLSYDIDSIIKNIGKRPWKMHPYSKQNWGNWLHCMSAYVGRITPSFAHFLIKFSCKENEVLLDPFCGIGTIPLEANLLGIKSIGIDLNPYAYAISRAKMDRRPIEEHIHWLKKVKLDTKSVDVKKIPDFIKEYYHPETLKEVFALRDLLIKEKKWFLLGCFLGIVHGHRPAHLSRPSGLIIPYKPKDKNPEYKEVIPRMILKVERMYRDGFTFDEIGKIHLADARKMPLEDNSVDVVVSSPPYFDTLDYVGGNRLRLAIMGVEPEKQENLKDDLIQNKRTYLDEMKIVGLELKRVLKPKGRIIFILGDLHKNGKRINTAEEVKKLYNEIGFKTHAIIDDELPLNKSVQRKDENTRLDRIMVMTHK